MIASLASAVRAAALAIGLLFVALPAHALTFPEAQGRRVADEANILTPQVRADLSAKLQALEEKTGDQFEVVTVKSLEGDDVEDYSNKLFRHWGIGQKGKDNGVMLLVAPNERKARIEVGGGLEGVMTDAVSSVILNTRVFPAFRANDYPGGIAAGTDAVIEQLMLDPDTAKARADAAARAQVRPHHSSGGMPLPIIFVIIILFLVLSRTMRGGIWPWLLLSSLSGRGGGWGGGGGWSGGGGGGGFSGGGGSSGGGGASGGW